LSHTRGQKPARREPVVPALQPIVPDDFWHRDDVRAALADRDVGTILQLLNRKYGISQTKLAAFTQMSQAQLSGIFLHKTRVTASHLFERIGQGLQMPDHARSAFGLAPNHQEALPSTRSLQPETPPPLDPVPTEARRVHDQHGILLQRQPTLIVPGSNSPEGLDMYRRTLIASGPASLAVAAMLALETTRHDLTAAFANPLRISSTDLTADPDGWAEIVTDYGYAYMSTAPADLFNLLLIDLFEIERTVTRVGDRHTALQTELLKASALLAALLAMTLANMGNLVHAKRWWRTARTIAQKSSDTETITWIRAREVVRALYENRPLGSILQLAESTTREMSNPSIVTQLELVSGTAQALSVAGRKTDALHTLQRLEGLFEALPDYAHDSASVFCWAEDRLRFTESYVYSHLGNAAKAAVAQDQAVRLYAPGNHRGPAQIELQRALCLVREGDSGQGAQHALTTISQLNSRDLIRPVVDLGNGVLNAVAPQDASQPAVACLREYLMSLQPPATTEGLPGPNVD
jgi:hypothetical protein